MGTANTARGDALRCAREARPWTQAQLAAAADVSPRTVIRAEAGGDATAETLMALCGALGIDAGSLPDGSAQPVDTPVVDTKESLEQASPPPLPGASGRGGMARRLMAATALACLCAASWHIAWAGSLAWTIRDLPTFKTDFDRMTALIIASDAASAGRAVAMGETAAGTTWNEIFDTRHRMGMRNCPNRGFVDYLTGGDGEGCTAPPAPINITVAASGPELVEFTVGPMRRTGLGALTRMLPRDPRLRVTASYSTNPRPAAWGTLRFEPNALAADQIPLAPEGLAFLNVRIEPKEIAR